MYGYCTMFCYVDSFGILRVTRAEVAAAIGCSEFFARRLGSSATGLADTENGFVYRSTEAVSRSNPREALARQAAPPRPSQAVAAAAAARARYWSRWSRSRSRSREARLEARVLARLGEAMPASRGALAELQAPDSIQLSPLNCGICMEVLGLPGAPNVITLPCLHTVHYSCFMSIPGVRPRCPCCRQEPIELASRHRPVCLCGELTEEPCCYGWLYRGWVCPLLNGERRSVPVRLRPRRDDARLLSSDIWRPPRAD